MDSSASGFPVAPVFSPSAAGPPCRADPLGFGSGPSPPFDADPPHPVSSAPAAVTATTRAPTSISFMF